MLVRVPWSSAHAAGTELEGVATWLDDAGVTEDDGNTSRDVAAGTADEERGGGVAVLEDVSVRPEEGAMLVARSCDVTLQLDASSAVLDGTSVLEARPAVLDGWSPLPVDAAETAGEELVAALMETVMDEDGASATEEAALLAPRSRGALVEGVHGAEDATAASAFPASTAARRRAHAVDIIIPSARTPSSSAP